MAVLTNAAFLSKWSSLFADNSTRDISEQDLRDFRQDIADSFLNITDGGTISANIGIRVTPTAALHVKTASSSIMKLERDSTVGVYGLEQAASSIGLYDHTNSAYRWRVTSATLLLNESTGGVAIGRSSATAKLHLPAGTATANTAPLKLTTGTALTTPEDGALEYHSSHLYFTIGSTRYQLDQQGGTSGTYTPTITNTANLDTTTSLGAQYIRVNNVVHVSGAFTADVTASGTFTDLRLTLPVASNLGSQFHCSGVVNSQSLVPADNIGGAIEGDTTNDEARVVFYSSGTGARTYYFTFTYRVI